MIRISFKRLAQDFQIHASSRRNGHVKSEFGRRGAGEGGVAPAAGSRKRNSVPVYRSGFQIKKPFAFAAYHETRVRKHGPEGVQAAQIIIVADQAPFGFR